MWKMRNVVLKGAFCLAGVLWVISLGFDLALGEGTVDSLRCGTKLVRLGDSKYEVVSSCGEPVWREQVGKDYVAAGSKLKERIDEEWTYDFGPRDFTYTLRFAGGKLKAIMRGPRGSR